MNTLKLLLSGILACASTTLFSATLPEKDMLHRIDSQREPLFYRKDVLKKFNPVLLDTWYNAVDMADEFVKEHATLDRKLTNAMAVIKKENTVICRRITLLKRAIGSGLDKYGIMAEGNSTVSTLETARANIHQAVKPLSRKYLIPGNQKAKNVIDKLVKTINEIVQDTINDIKLGGHLR